MLSFWLNDIYITGYFFPHIWNQEWPRCLETGFNRCLYSTILYNNIDFNISTLFLTYNGDYHNRRKNNLPFTDFSYAACCLKKCSPWWWPNDYGRNILETEKLLCSSWWSINLQFTLSSDFAKNNSNKVYLICNFNLHTYFLYRETQMKNKKCLFS
jgi:hypothetical protein